MSTAEPYNVWCREVREDRPPTSWHIVSDKPETSKVAVESVGSRQLQAIKYKQPLEYVCAEIGRNPNDRMPTR